MKSEDVNEKKAEPQSVVDKEETEEEEFFTLEELEDLENQSIGYIVRKFSNIRFKNNKAFKPRQYNGSSLNSTRSRAPYKGGYNIGSVD